MEVRKFPFQILVKDGELAEAAGAQLPSSHVDVEHHKLLPVALNVFVAGDGDGHGPLLTVVVVDAPRRIVARVQAISFLLWD